MVSIASYADVLTGSSRGIGTRDEPLRTFAWEAVVSIVDHSVHHEIELT